MSGPEDNPMDDMPADKDEWETWEKEQRRKEALIFTHCNVCGVLLRTGDSEQMGMCERCANE